MHSPHPALSTTDWLEPLLQQKDQPSCLLDGQFKFVAWNHAMVPWLDEADGSKKQSDLWALIATKDHDHLHEVVAPLLQGRTSSVTTPAFTLKGCDGHVQCSLQLSTLASPDLATPLWLCLFKDLRTSAAVEPAPETTPAWPMAPFPNALFYRRQEDGTPLHFTPALSRMVGDPQDAGLQESFTQLFADPDQLPPWQQDADRPRWQLRQMERTFRAQDGKLHPCHLYEIRSTDAAGIIYGHWQPSAPSTVPAAQLQQKLQQLEKAHHIKDYFYTLIHQNIRAPLASMVILLEHIEEEQLLPNDLAAASQEAQQRLQDLMEMSAALLDPNRIHSNQLRTSSVFLNAQQLVQRVSRVVQSQAEARGVEIDNRITDGQRLYGDPHLLTEILRHLTTKAITFSQPGERIAILVEEAGKQSYLVLRSLGLGQHLPALSACLTQPTGNKSPTKRLDESENTLCMAVMEAHNGEIQIGSKAGEGGEIRLAFPNATPRILVVDDSEVERLTLRVPLEALGAQVMEADGAESAFKMMLERQPDLILTDVRMPEIDGFELLEAIKQNPLLAQIPVIMLTIDEKPESRNRAFQQGAADFINKPVQFHDLEPRIRRLLG
uniref:Putative hybrid histidine kinase with response regulator receiver domain n=1 Tax=Magnetococcus massalia (strain MO-1) TaxID=451514 RepID=A0A1S7LIN9_MAGMO|nr:putative hybrid histidine kinase with response regulator receiver domain [Candidatus Magnetococcus massalia]